MTLRCAYPVCVVLGAALSASLPPAAVAARPASPSLPDTAAAPVVTEISLDHFTGINPASGLVLAADGNLYGAAEHGGTAHDGTLYRVTPAGRVQTIHDFVNGSDGRRPSATPLVGSDGALYGSALGGTLGRGLLFKVTPDGAFTVLHAFRSDGSEGEAPHESLIQARDGNLYGVTADGGAGDHGVVFRVSPQGDFAVLATFDGRIASHPSGPLLEGDDGNFYGTALAGGAHGRGVLFSVSPTGKIASLHDFTGTPKDGGLPTGGVVYDAAHSAMYGVTSHDTIGMPWVFYRYAGGRFKRLARFVTDFAPGQLALGPDGRTFYAVYFTGVFAFTPEGQVTPVVTIDADADPPRNQALVFNASGAMFGTSYFGGTQFDGFVFRVKGF